MTIMTQHALLVLSASLLCTPLLALLPVTVAVSTGVTMAAIFMPAHGTRARNVDRGRRHSLCIATGQQTREEVTQLDKGTYI